MAGSPFPQPRSVDAPLSGAVRPVLPSPPPVSAWDAIRDSASSAWQVTRLNARDEAQRAALWRRHDQVRDLTGQTLTASESMIGLSLVPGDPRYPVFGEGLSPRTVTDAEYERRLDDIRQRFPAATTPIPTADAVHAQVDARLKAIAGAAASSSAEHPLAGFLGGSAASMADPVNLGLMAMTGGVGEIAPAAGAVAVPLLRQLGLGGLRQAAIWGGAAAAEAPLKAAEAQRAGGPAYGLPEAASDVVENAAGAFVAHGVGTLIGATAHAFLNRNGRVAPPPEPAGAQGADAPPTSPPPAVAEPLPPERQLGPPWTDAEFEDVSPAAGPAGSPDAPAPPPLLALPPPEVRGGAAALDGAAAYDAAVGSLRDGGDYEAGVTSLEHQAPMPTVEPRAEPADLFNGDLEAVEAPTPTAGAQVMETATYRGRDIHTAILDPGAVSAAPELFQYKAGGDDAGVTDRLRGVETWDPTRAGMSMAYETGSGQLLIADGHQRLALAQRLADQAPRLNGFLFRQADGWTPSDVRVLAALKNIGEGSGTPLDAAKVFREAPGSVNDDALPATGAVVEQGRGLARLSEPAFRAVVDGVVPERYAHLIGQMAGERPDIHERLIDLLHHAKPASADVAAGTIHADLQHEFEAGEGRDADMFGHVPQQSTVIAHGKVMASVMTDLKQSARTFGNLTRNADAIEAGGNTLARDANEAAMAVNRAAQSVVFKLVGHDPELNTALRSAVEAVMDGRPVAEAARGVSGRVRELVEEMLGGEAQRKAAINPDAPRASARAAAEAFGDPGGKGQADQLRQKPEDQRADPRGARELPETPADEAELHPHAEATQGRPTLFDDIQQPVPERAALDELRACAPG